MALYPDEPWRWNADWETGILRCKPPARLAFQWMFSAFLSCVGFFVAVNWTALAKDDQSTFLFGGSIVMAMVVLLPTIFSTLRWWKWRDMVCELHTNPGAIGGRLVASIRTPVSPGEIDSVETRLICYYYDPKNGIDTGHGMRTELWREVQTIDPQSLGADEQGNALIPVDFAIPSTCEASTAEMKSERVQWELAVRGKVAGFNLSAIYIVPIFQVAGEQSIPGMAYAAPDMPTTRSQTIETKECGDGIEFRYVDNALRILFALVFTITIAVQIAAFTYLRSTAPMPLVVWIGIACFGCPLVYATLRLWFGQYCVELSPTSITEVSSMLGIRRRKVIPLGKILLVDAQVDGRSGKTLYYAIRVHTDSGVRLVLKGIRDKAEADGLVRQIEEYLVRYRSGAA